MAANSALEQLPLLILQSICEFVDCDGFDRQDLIALALASKTCYEASQRHHFDSIHINVEGPEQLIVDVKSLQDVLAVGKRCAFVRRLEITGRTLGHPDEPFESRRGRRCWQNTVRAQRILTKSERERRSDESCMWKLDYSWPTETFPEADKTWTPLAELVATLTGLRDLMFESPQQIPRCLLDALRQHCPRTRLHMHNFNLRSLSKDPEEPPKRQIYPDEWELVTSPNLHCVAYISNNTVGKDSPAPGYNHDAIIRMFGGLAPNLRLLHWTGSFSMSDSQLQSPRLPWNIEGTRSGAGPHSLVYETFWDPLPVLGLEAWENGGDLGHLRNLEMGSNISVQMAQKLCSMARSGAFRSLRSISGGFEDFRDEKKLIMTDLFRNLPPLESICIAGSLRKDGPLFQVILDHHGKTLRKLSQTLGTTRVPVVSSSYWAQKIDLLREHCPYMETLEFTTIRSRDKAEEMAMYQALGRMPRLKHVMLKLLIWDYPRVEGPSFYLGNEQEECLEGLRECLIQCAFDESLACSLFRMMDGGALEWLDLRVQASWDGDLSVYQMLGWISNCWHVRKTGPGVLVAEETGLLADGAPRRRDILTKLMRKDFRDMPKIKDIWTSIWPGEPKTPGDWSDHWWSFPLGGDDGQ